MQTARQLNDAFVEVAERVSPAVVVIEVAHRPDYRSPDERDNPALEAVPPEMRRRFEEQSEKRRQEALAHKMPVYDSRGSGIVIRDDGWILTNGHVLDGAEKVRIRLKDDSVYLATGQWFTDAQSDLAVVKIDAHGLTTARLADSSKTRVGEFAIAIGAPFDLDYSVTFGHVSAKSRSHVIPNWMGTSLAAAMDQDFIQTDASINPGNSGGPLVNIDGEVIGVNTLIHGLNRGVGFAIPSNLARQVADHLIAEGKFTRAWLGIQINSLSEDTEFRSLLRGLQEGVVVRKIMPNGPASKSGLQPADVITAVEHSPVTTAQELRNALRSRPIGNSFTLDVVRPVDNGKSKPLQLTLRTESWPEDNPPDTPPPVVEKTKVPAGLGLTVQKLTPALAKKYGIEMAPGLVVTAVQPYSPAALQRIRPGDLITQINRRPVASPKDFTDVVTTCAGKAVLVDLISDGAPEFRILKDGGD